MQSAQQQSSQFLAFWNQHLSSSYLGKMFSVQSASTLLWYGVLRYADETLGDFPYLLVEEVPGLLHAISLPHFAFKYVLQNATSAHGYPRVLLDYKLHDPNLRVVPQIRWVPYNGGARAVAELENRPILPPFFFIQHDQSVGVPLQVAKTANPLAIVNTDWTPFAGRASIKLRIGWYGYAAWEDQIQLRTRTTSAAITLGRLAQLVATRVEKFLLEGKVLVESRSPEWRIGGPNGISPENIVLVGVVSVSGGSIMPILRLA
ncbi:hypothetical protein BV25DRAFT_1827196 [Artomyces pyxidatus]|uniref:Uncharacterized protein n=1 Tax=Artomyces pyxidatus TaxID=48021 RepID=A0ACB8SXZ7_9AGAM|nr:hypothetical protein BV25DRAFT_1827196 [Artomyces pyxidatus]